MQPADVIAHACLEHLVTPLLANFLSQARNQSNAWANQVIGRLVENVGEQVPETWRVTITGELAPAIVNLLGHGKSVSLETLTVDPANRALRLPLVALLLVRGEETLLLPERSEPLQIGDRILFCGKPDAKSAQPLLLINRKVLGYVMDGIEVPDGLVWRWISDRRYRRS